MDLLFVYRYRYYVLEEDGVHNIFLPVNDDDDIPNCFSLQSARDYISFDVLLDGHKKIYGMNICISYKVSHTVLHKALRNVFLENKHECNAKPFSVSFDYKFELKFGLPDLPEKALLLGITNETKNLEWVYSPTCYAIPRDVEKIQWVSHWRFGDQIEVGDKVSIHVSAYNGFHINKCGVELVYEDEENCEMNWE